MQQASSAEHRALASILLALCLGCGPGNVGNMDGGMGLDDGGGSSDATLDSTPADSAVPPDATLPPPDADPPLPDADPPLPDADPPVPDADPPMDDFCRGADVVLSERLQGSSSTGGTVSGGTFTPEGWRTTATSSQLYWDLGESVSSGSIDFWAQGLHANVGGCVWGVCYYVGIFEESSGDKLTHYTGSAFIESRFHTNDQENFHDTIKLQAGAGDGSMREPMIPPGIGWAPDSWHHYRIEWGGGESRLYIDDARRLTANYPNDRTIAWRHLFLGTTNYKGLGWAPVGVTFRELCVRGGA